MYSKEERFSHIEKLLSNKNYNKALTEYQEYINRYEDCYAYVKYADLLIKLGKFNEASNILNCAEEIMNKKTETFFHIIKVNLYCCLGKYEEAYNYFIKHKLKYMDKLYSHYIFLQKQVGLLKSSDIKNSYLFNQIDNYSEELFYQHISNKYINSDEFAQFNADFSLKDFVEKIKPLLSMEDEVLNIYRIYNSCMDNHFYFQYDNNGKVKGKTVDYIKVVVFNHTSDIITMFPYENIENRVCLDINSLKDEPKIKKLSAVDKFNKKYNIK